MTRPPRNIRVDPSHVVNTGRIRRDINPGPNSMFPECPGANDDIAVFELRGRKLPTAGQRRQHHHQAPFNRPAPPP